MVTGLGAMETLSSAEFLGTGAGWSDKRRA